MRIEAIYALYSNACTTDRDKVFNKDGDIVEVDESLIQTKIAELEAAEPMRLLRIQRDKKLQESDWRTNNDYPYDDADAWATYRTQLRNLPAEIAAGNVPAPSMQDGALVFDNWPEPPT